MRISGRAYESRPNEKFPKNGDRGFPVSAHLYFISSFVSHQYICIWNCPFIIPARGRRAGNPVVLAQNYSMCATTP